MAKKAKLPLSKTHPKLAKEAHGWDPEKLSIGSGQKVSWICALGHIYEGRISNRVYQKSNCPVCGNKKVLAGFNDLATKFPEIAKEADGWDPTTVIAGSNKKMSWKCPVGHKYVSRLSARMGKHRIGCGVCANQTVLFGFNDLATKFPEIAKEADGWDPSTVIAGSNKKANWRCPIGHKYESSIIGRTLKNKGCATCANQKVLSGFNDLATKFPEIAKEADGWDPTTVIAGSNKKANWRCIKRHHYESTISSRTLRKTNCPICSNQKILLGFNDLATKFPEIAKEADGWDPTTVVFGSDVKRKWKCIKGHHYESMVSSRTLQKTNCPICTNKKVLAGFNDLATKFPEIAKEADGWDPTTVIAGSHINQLWKCSKQHSYKASVMSRTRQDSNCPICSNHKVLVGFNDLATKFPEIAKEADGWDPTTVVFGSEIKRKWKCHNGHNYESSVYGRTSISKRGCPVCANQKILVGFNDLATKFPEIAKEADGWDPSTVIAGSNKKANWRCPIGHKYESSIIGRAFQNKGCATCANQKVLAGFNDLATKFPEIAKEADGWDPTTTVAGSDTKKSWKCPMGHKWRATIGNRKNGRGCPTCAIYGYDPNQKGYLYFIENPDWGMFQIGITNVPDDRLKDHKKLGWKLLELRGPMDGHLTQQWETAILRMLKAKGADLSNKEIAGKFDGYSEAWSQSTFPVKSIKELMRLTEEFEELQNKI
jgi:hypothetical protein